jgi:hypothetical protein
MTPQFVAGICSFLGALLFVGAGFFLAKHLLALDKGKLEQEIQTIKEREKFVQEEIIKEKLSFKKYIDRSRQKNAAFKKATQKRIFDLMAKLKRLNAVLGDYKERLDDLVVDVTRTDSEKVLLQEALENTKKDLKDIADIENENKALNRELEQIKSQLKEIDHLQAENQALNEKLTEMENLKAQVEAMKAEKVRANNAAKFSEELLQPKKSSSEEIAHPEIVPGREGLGQVFRFLVDQISRLEGSRGVVVADKQGLLVAGIGDYKDSMAGLATICPDVANIISGLIPFGDIDIIRITNIHNLTITMLPFELDSEKLVLTTLAKGEGPTRETITRFTQQALVS